MNEPCHDFADLVLSFRSNIDYEIEVIERGSPFCIVAVHGGGIDPLTEELARAVAGRAHSLYLLRALKPEIREQLRIPARRYKEMRLDNMMQRSKAALSIVGCACDDVAVHLGGQNRRLKGVLETHLIEQGFETGSPVTPGASHSPTRFYNRADQGGVQIELGEKLRASLLDAPLTSKPYQEAGRRNARFDALVGALKDALANYEQVLATDLDHTLERFEQATSAIPPSIRQQPQPKRRSFGDNGDGPEDTE